MCCDNRVKIEHPKVLLNFVGLKLSIYSYFVQLDDNTKGFLGNWARYDSL